VKGFPDKLLPKAGSGLVNIMIDTPKGSRSTFKPMGHDGAEAAEAALAVARWRDTRRRKP
jgi:hypothetical protein